MCLGTNVCGHKCVWAQVCLGTSVSGHKRCVGTNVSGHNRVWAQMCLGTSVSGHKRCVGTNVSGHNRVWAQTCVDTNVSGHNHVGSSMYGHKRVVSMPNKAFIWGIMAYWGTYEKYTQKILACDHVSCAKFRFLHIITSNSFYSIALFVYFSVSVVHFCISNIFQQIYVLQQKVNTWA